ncbi:MAG: transferase [Verrucomicrobia bacterium]|nr:MAG: transferase [Verrucomicrobiota bacterium]
MKLSREELDGLRKLSTPTVSNAIELFNVRPRNQGFMSPDIRCLFPDFGVMAGYAVTGRFAANQPGTRPASRYDFWKHVLEIPEPRVLVLQDLDQPPGVGAYFGEVQTHIHRRLGCVGVVTNGCVRDLDEVRELGFHYFARGICVSHAYVHLIDFGSPVNVGATTVHPGDLIHADKHGVLVLPVEIARDIPAAAAKIAGREQRIVGHCGSPDFSLEELKRLFEAD